MKIFLTAILFFLIGGLSMHKAQCIKVISIKKQTQIGGREESRKEILEIVLKENPKIEPLYLLADNRKIDFTKSITGDKVVLTAILQSSQDNFMTIDGIGEQKTFENYNLSKLFLYYKNNKNNKISSRKIKIKQTDLGDSNKVPTLDVPQ